MSKKISVMDYIKRSLKIVNNELETDSNSFNHALDELKNRIKELTPLFNECIEKGISIEEISPELNKEWNEIILAIRNREKMQRQSIIVFIQGDRVETYGNLKKCCELEGLKYWTLSRLKFPIMINDVVIHKTLFK